MITIIVNSLHLKIRVHDRHDPMSLPTREILFDFKRQHTIHNIDILTYIY